MKLIKRGMAALLASLLIMPNMSARADEKCSTVPQGAEPETH